MRSLANMVPGGQWAHKRKKVDFKKETMHHRLDSVDNSLDLCVCVVDALVSETVWTVERQF